MALGRRQLVSILTILLCLGFAVTTVVNYMVSRNLIRQSIVDSELPLTSDNIYSEIQKDLVRPIFVSSMMAGDTFLRDWMLSGERDATRITRYLAEVKQRYGANTSFLVADKSRNYYQSEGLLKQVSPSEPRDVWFYRVRGMSNPYEINVDPDLAHRDRLTIFVNYRVLDYNGGFLGVTGVGLAVDSVRKLIDDYQQRYHRTVYFVDQEGNIPLFASNEPLTANIKDIEGLRELAPRIFAGQEGAFEYSKGRTNHLLNVRYIPELHWYLFVEKREDEALGGIRHTLYINLAISTAVTLLVLFLVNIAIGRYQQRLENLAMTDKLTGLANRQALDLMMQRDLAEQHRTRMDMAALLLDLDRFKSINDKYGHLGGDVALRIAAETIRSHLRESDLVGRWGGEEFLVFLKRADATNAMMVAEKVRHAIEEAEISLNGERVNLSISIGVAVVHDGDTQDSLVNRADRALYAAKQGGRNRVVLDE